MFCPAQLKIETHNRKKFSHLEMNPQSRKDQDNSCGVDAWLLEMAEVSSEFRFVMLKKQEKMEISYSEKHKYSVCLAIKRQIKVWPDYHIRYLVEENTSCQRFSWSGERAKLMWADVSETKHDKFRLESMDE